MNRFLLIAMSVCLLSIFASAQSTPMYDDKGRWNVPYTTTTTAGRALKIIDNANREYIDYVIFSWTYDIWIGSGIVVSTWGYHSNFEGYRIPAKTAYSPDGKQKGDVWVNSDGSGTLYIMKLKE